MNPASFIEHQLLKPTATMANIELLCEEAIQYGFAAVCVPPMFVKKAKELISGTNIKLATVIGFPFGYSVLEAKLSETVLAIVDGADELNVVINLVALKNKDWQYLAKELNTILAVVRKSERQLKVIIEAGSLTSEEIIACCDLYGAAGIDFIQTSTGYAENPVSMQSIKLIRTHLANAVQLKHGDAIEPGLVSEYINAGITRITCADPVKLMGESIPGVGGMIFEKQTVNKN